MRYDDPNTALFNKMTAEQEQYKAELLLKSPQEILNSAYEYALREDILFSIPKYFNTSFVINALAEGVSYTRLDAFAHDAYHAACKKRDFDG